MPALTTLLLKLPRNQDITPEAAKTFLSALTQINSVSTFQRLLGTRPHPLAFEIAAINQQIQFLITCDNELVPFVKTQIQSSYPLVIIEKVEDPILSRDMEIIELKLAKGSYYPIGTYDKFADVDPISSTLSVLSKVEPTEFAIIQISLEGTRGVWQSKANQHADRGVKNEDGSYQPRSDKNIIIEKTSYQGFKVSIRLASSATKTAKELVNALGVFARADANFFKKNSSIFNSVKALNKNIKIRKVVGNQVLNIMELATLWHLPSEKIKVTGIAWGTSVLSEPPDNLPNAVTATEEEKIISIFLVKLFSKTTIQFLESKILIAAGIFGQLVKQEQEKAPLLQTWQLTTLKKARV